MSVWDRNWRSALGAINSTEAARGGEQGDEVDALVEVGQPREPAREWHREEEGEEDLRSRQCEAELPHELVDILGILSLDPLLPLHDRLDAQAW